MARHSFTKDLASACPCLAAIQAVQGFALPCLHFFPAPISQTLFL